MGSQPRPCPHTEPKPCSASIGPSRSAPSAGSGLSPKQLRLHPRISTGIKQPAAKRLHGPENLCKETQRARSGREQRDEAPAAPPASLSRLGASARPAVLPGWHTGSARGMPRARRGAAGRTGRAGGADGRTGPRGRAAGSPGTAGGVDGRTGTGTSRTPEAQEQRHPAPLRAHQDARRARPGAGTLSISSGHAKTDGQAGEFMCLVDPEAQRKVLELTQAAAPPRPGIASRAELRTVPFFRDKPSPSLPRADNLGAGAVIGEDGARAAPTSAGKRFYSPPHSRCPSLVSVFSFTACPVRPREFIQGKGTIPSLRKGSQKVLKG